MSELKSDDLKALIERPDRTEIKCGNFIPLIWDKLLLGYRPIKLIKVKEEYRGNLGDCDYLIVAEVSEGARICNKAFFWELKAPQCIIFQKDPKNENRLMPSQDLSDAENKLLHYYLEHRENPKFHREWGLEGTRDVLLGGIIIGKNDTKVGTGIEDEDKERLYNLALGARYVFYDGVKMRLMTWDEIYDILMAQEAAPIKVPEEIPVEEVIPMTKTQDDVIFGSADLYSKFIVRREKG